MKYLYLFLLISYTTCAQQINTDELNLMPWPQNIILQDGTFQITKDFNINITGNPNPRIYSYATRFLRRLDGRTGNFFTQSYTTSSNQKPNAQLQINCLQQGKIDISQDESYQLKITPKNITIDATSDLGAMHALETLLQLLTVQDGQFVFPALAINDAPQFTWRGLMIDVARHFQPIEVITRNLDAMAALKLNIFHWHLTDDQGWRVEIKSLPQLTTQASDGLFYTQEDIKYIVNYAAERGIMVIPEIDVPGHATAILTAIPEIGSFYNKDKTIKTYTLERNAGIFDPTLDPTNPKTYIILQQIFDEVCALFPSNYFHIGGDENEGKDWDANPKIAAFKKEHQLKTNHDLQTYFNMKLLKILQANNKEVMGWEEIMTPNMSKNAIIHSWKGVNEGLQAGESLINAAKSGYKTVLSNGFYIDLALGIEEHYNVMLIDEKANLTTEEKSRILGGEATMWGELVTPATIDSRIWPRTAAIAERLWSKSTVTDVDFMRKRIVNVSFRLEELGVQHIKNKTVLLRNIANNQNIHSLDVLSKVCEPLKIYTRNKGGTEYQSYSPFTLFADACTPDAEDAFIFEKRTTSYLKNKSPENTQALIYYFDLWIQNHEELKQLSTNAPLIQPLLPVSQNLSDIANEFKRILTQQQKINKEQLAKLLAKCESKNHADIELAVSPSLKKLLGSI
jgi:hexosaminidase